MERCKQNNQESGNEKDLEVYTVARVGGAEMKKYYAANDQELKSGTYYKTSYAKGGFAQYYLGEFVCLVDKLPEGLREYSLKHAKELRPSMEIMRASELW